MVKAKQLKMLRKIMEKSDRLDCSELFLFGSRIPTELPIMPLSLQNHNCSEHGATTSISNNTSSTNTCTPTEPTETSTFITNSSTSTGSSTATTIEQQQQELQELQEQQPCPLSIVTSNSSNDSTDCTLDNPKTLLYASYYIEYMVPSLSDTTTTEKELETRTRKITITKTSPLTITTKKMMSNDIFEQCIEIFHDNMKELYTNSSWGYNIQTKIDEMKHNKAKYLILLSHPETNKITAAATTTTTVTVDCRTENNNNNEVNMGGRCNTNTTANDNNTNINTNQSSKCHVAGFVHFRFCYDDDDDPNSIVLYIYEIQVHKQYQKKYGIGCRLMKHIEAIAKKASLGEVDVDVEEVNVKQQQQANASTGRSIGVPIVGRNYKNSNHGKKKTGIKTKKATTTASSTDGITSPSSEMPVPVLSKIMLTVFKKNTDAMKFYRNKLQYEIDPSSPSKHGQCNEDYEILSKAIHYCC